MSRLRAPGASGALAAAALAGLACLAGPRALRAESPPPARVERDLPTFPGAGPRQRVDVHAPASTAGGPVVVFVHGGGWRRGDRSRVGEKPAGFTARGVVLVSAGYRLHPEVSVHEQAADVARAVRWARENAERYGASPERIFLMGHSAGAHLAAWVALDPRFLAAEGLRPGALRGVVLLDGAGYDVPRQVQDGEHGALRRLYTTVFGDDPVRQRDASPLAHVGGGGMPPPFLLFHVAARRDAATQAEALAGRLREAGGEATVVPVADRSHRTLNTRLGTPGDGPTERILAFLGVPPPAP